MNRELLRPIAEKEILAYEEDGVIWLRGIIDPEWASRLGEAIDDFAVNPRAQAMDFTNAGLASTAPEKVSGFRRTGAWVESEWASPRQMVGDILLDETVKPLGPRGHFLSVTGTSRIHPFIRELAVKSPIAEIAAVLMRSRNVYLTDDQILIKPPGTMEKTAWHQDLGYNHMEGDQLCAIRIPATAETSEMGLVQYLKGSHRPIKVYKVNYFVTNATNGEDASADIPQIDGHESEFDLAIPVPEPGDVVVHHLATLHGARGNRSVTGIRKAITFRYAGEDVRHTFRRFAPPQDPIPLKDGEPLSNAPDRFPLCWPRPAV